MYIKRRVQVGRIHFSKKRGLLGSAGKGVSCWFDLEIMKKLLEIFSSDLSEMKNFKNHHRDGKTSDYRCGVGEEGKRRFIGNI